MPDITSGRRELILFVDDDASLLRLGRLTLERAGYAYLGALGGREALQKARDSHPDLILLDYMMPDISGKDVFDALRQSDDAVLRSTPVVMLTALTNREAEKRELLEKGLAAYLQKPFGYRELLNVIENALILNGIRKQNDALEMEARRSFLSMVRSLVTLMFAKDTYTGKHAESVARLAEALALFCGIPEGEVLTIKLGALLHDVGKIGVPESVLCKPSCLTRDEMSVMRRHVHHGEQALAGLPRMDSLRSMVLHHHEWWNGDGYPARLCGKEIPLGARIIAVVDAYDAMVSDCPYRDALSQEVAFERLRAGAGTQFDPILVSKFISYLSQANSTVPPPLNFESFEATCQIV